MNETPHDVLHNGGGTINGEHFNSIAELFQSMGCEVITGYDDPRAPAPFEPPEGKVKKNIIRARKAERQRRKKGRR